MIGVLLIALCVVVASVTGRDHHRPRRNQLHKAINDENEKNFENRLQAAVSVALLNGAPLDDTTLQTFIKTFGAKDQTFEKTFELLNAIVAESTNQKRKRNDFHHDEHHDDERHDEQHEQHEQDDQPVLLSDFNNRISSFINSLTAEEKNDFRVAALVDALAAHLQDGRQKHDLDDIAHLVTEYLAWKQANAKLLSQPKAAERLTHHERNLFNVDNSKNDDRRHRH